jgi:hypothetical protein
LGEDDEVDDDGDVYEEEDVGGVLDAGFTVLTISPRM